MILRAIVVSLACVAGSTVLAAPVSPSVTPFGPLSQTEFGGIGIPNTSVAVTEFTVPSSGGTTSNTVTLGLTATQRFFNPALSNDGAGTFTAGTGENTGGPGSTSTTVSALWNFNFFASVTGDGDLDIADLGLQLLYDLDAGMNTDRSALGI